MKVGEKVLLPEYGGTKVILDEKVQYTFQLIYHRYVSLFGKFSWLIYCHSSLTPRTISCSVMEISLENMSIESSFVVAVRRVDFLSSTERRAQVLSCLFFLFISLLLKL